MKARHFAKPQRVEDDSLDRYATGGVALSRDAAHATVAALRRDAAEMRARGGYANLEGAKDNELLAHNIGKALSTPYSALVR